MRSSSLHPIATDISAVVSPIHTNQRVEKTFTVSKSNAKSATDELRIHIYTPGLTIIRVQPKLCDEFGREVVARVRISSDHAEYIERVCIQLKGANLHLKYHPQRGSMGHLVTEIELPHEAQVVQVIAMGRGDVVITEGVLGPPTSLASSAKEQISSTDLMSFRGARLLLTVPHNDLHFNDLFLGCLGGGSIVIVAQRLTLEQELATGLFGHGTIQIHTQELTTKILKVAALGKCHLSLHAQCKLRVHDMCLYQNGQGVIRVASGGRSEPSLIQTIRMRRGGVVDVADVPSRETVVEIKRSARRIVRIQAPQHKLSLEGRMRRGAVEYVGTLPCVDGQSKRKMGNINMKLKGVSWETLKIVRKEYEADYRAVPVFPTIERAFEQSTALEKPQEGWISTIGPTVRCLFPFQ